MIETPSRIEVSPWQFATVEKIVVETPRVKTFTLRLNDWIPFRAGQHFDVRLTAPDGYQAQRSYSIASAPETVGAIDLTVELIEDGEVSPFFHEVVQTGDQIEMRGPIGGPFTWTAGMGGPLLLVGGGSGIVPLMSILRHMQNVAPEVRAVLLYSSRTWDDVIYRNELTADDEAGRLVVQHTLTRSRPAGWSGYARRIDSAMLSDCLGLLDGAPLAYVCGPNGLVESAASTLLDLGIPANRIHTERFGPTA
jgi:ferredoxin-NADP reductase